MSAEPIGEGAGNGDDQDQRGQYQRGQYQRGQDQRGMSGRIAIVGSGLIGRAWAISFARAGRTVALYDPTAGAASAALDYVDGVLADLAHHDLLRGQDPAAVRGRLTPVGGLAEALAGASYVQESSPEDLATKRAVFAELDRLADPAAILASSSSALVPSSFTEALAGRARCLVVHPINPPYLVPAVELVPAPWTTAATLEQARLLMVEIGQAPIVMKGELDGFIMNRLQGALLQEAFRLIADGHATPEDVDIGLKQGIGLRWSFIGPFETIDLNAPGGVRDYVRRYEALYQRLWPSQNRIASWAGTVDALEAARAALLPRDRLSERQAWRDRRLMALAAHKRQADDDIGT
jgi:3-hydroxyacyl-CoA dehydrogenase